MRGLVLILILGLVACGPARHDAPSQSLETGSGGGEEAQTVEKLLNEPEKIVFDDVNRLVLQKACIECHSVSGNNIAGVNVESFEALLGRDSKQTLTPFNPEDSSLYNTLILPKGQPRHMPPINQPQLTEDEINLVYQWIANGAKLEVTEKPDRPKSQAEVLRPFFDKPETIDYQVVNKHVFSKSCNDCHSANGSKASDEAILYGQDMTTYKGVISNFGIVPNQLEDKFVDDGEGGKKRKRGSRLYKSIAIHQSMPRESDGYEPVKALEVKLLRLWILNCAIEDFSAIEEDDLKNRPNHLGKIRNCPES